MTTKISNNKIEKYSFLFIYIFFLKRLQISQWETLFFNHKTINTISELKLI